MGIVIQTVAQKTRAATARSALPYPHLFDVLS
jgi:hypothetical protein